MTNEEIKKWLRGNGFEYKSGQWRVEIDKKNWLSNREHEMNRKGGRGFGRRSADAVVNSYHRTAECDTLDFLKKMGVIGFYQGVEYLPVFTDAPDFPIHEYYIESVLEHQEKIDRFM